jgi:hypothetical protein
MLGSRALAVAAAGALAAACGGDAEPVRGGSSGGPLQPTFSSLERGLFSQSCSGCHYPTYSVNGAAGGLDFTAPPATIYAALVSSGVSNDSFDVGRTAFPERVVPGNAEQSLLYQKLARDAPGDHGSQMPPTRAGPFDPAALAAVRAWIESGAPNN